MCPGTIAVPLILASTTGLDAKTTAFLIPANSMGSLSYLVQLCLQRYSFLSFCSLWIKELVIFPKVIIGTFVTLIGISLAPLRSEIWQAGREAKHLSR